MDNLPELQKTIMDIAGQLNKLPTAVSSIKLNIEPMMAAQKSLADTLASIGTVQTSLARTLASVQLPKLPSFENMYGLQTIYKDMSAASQDDKRTIGKAIKEEKQRYMGIIETYATDSGPILTPIDITAPFNLNTSPNERPKLLPTQQGSVHPLMREREVMLDIFYRMGFTASESRELDDDYHMFSSLNFPEGHPARDDYDTFMTEQTDARGKRLVAPAHTSTMQNRSPS